MRGLDLPARALAAGAVLLLFGVLAPPLRRAAAEGAVAPLVAAVAAPGAAVAPQPSPPSVVVRTAGGAGSYSVPGGLLWLAPCLLLALARPRRPLWLVLAGVLLAVSALDLAVFLAAAAGAPGAFALHDVLANYVLRAVGVGGALLLLYAPRIARRAEEAAARSAPPPAQADAPAR